MVLVKKSPNHRCPPWERPAGRVDDKPVSSPHRVLAQCSSVRTPEARVVTMNTVYLVEEWSLSATRDTRCGEGTGEGADTVAWKADEAALSLACISGE
eukprot:3226934-Pleurochrysis_carterae.AAC.1